MSKEEDQHQGGFLARVAQRARNLHIADAAQEQFQKVESRLMRELKARLDRAGHSAGDPYRAVRDTSSYGKPGATYVAVPVGDESPAEILQYLLLRSQDQTRDDARNSLYAKILKNMVPDEVLILSALSDGAIYPLIHIAMGPLFGPLTGRVLDNISNVGRQAGVACPQLVAVYVTNLRASGLAAEGPEDPSLGSKYEITETDELVMKACKQVEAQSMFRPRILRRSLKITDLGRALWDAAHPAE